MTHYERVIERTAFIALLLIIAALKTGAQNDDTLTLRSTTRLVQLNIVVLDKNGQPVSGLTQDDFQVFDNGREQKLVHFSASVVPTAPPSRSPLVITNRPEHESENPGSMTVILVDELVDQEPLAIALRHTIQSARLEILKFLGTLRPGDQVALYALRHEGVVVLHDFTDDPTVLVEAAKNLGTGLLSGPGSSRMGTALPHIAPSLPSQIRQTEAIRGWLSGSSHQTQASSNDDLRRIIAGDAFGAIAQHLKGIPGRKNVVWISTTFPSMTTGLNPGLMAQERDTILPNAWGPSQPVFASTESYHYVLRGFARYLSTKNVAVYPIDPRGLLVGGAGQSDAPSGSAPPPPVAPTVGPLVIGPWSTMDLVASETGGRAFYDTNALNRILREVVDENRVTYQLGYYPGDKAWDGKYHQVVVKTKRQGLILRCRKGYFALDEPIGNPEMALREVARGSLDGAGIGLTLNVSANPVEVGMQEIVLKLDTRDVNFRNDNGRWRANLDVAFTELSRDGRILGGVKDRLELALKSDTYATAQTEGWFYPKTVFVDPEAEKFRIVVRDLTTGTIGSVSVPVRHLVVPGTKSKG